MDFQTKEKYTVDDLVQIVKVLRSPNGCPWDKVQTHQTIRQDFIEEVYEAIEAIDTQNTELLKEELGDVLLQVVFHSELESETNSFTLNDVADGICKKLILRHPHVFGNINADTTDEVLKNWDEIKMKSKSQKTASEAMLSVSKALPSLMRSEKLQKKAKRVGFDFADTDSALKSLTEKLSSLENTVKNGDSDLYEEKLGELLFDVVNISRFLGVDCEKSLYRACDNFTERFVKLEKLAVQKGIDIENSDAQALNTLWNKIPKKEKKLEEN